VRPAGRRAAGRVSENLTTRGGSHEGKSGSFLFWNKKLLLVHILLGDNMTKKSCFGSNGKH